VRLFLPMGTALIGTIIVVTTNADSSGATWAGDIAVAIGFVFASLYAVGSSTVVDDHEPIAVTLVQQLFAFALIGPPLLILTAFSQREVVEDARDAGALAYLVKPYQKSDLIPAIEVAIGRFRELQQLSGEVDALGEQLEARKSIDKAKGVLIDECGMKETDAFTFIQRTAMSERSRMRDVAERILDGSLRP